MGKSFILYNLFQLIALVVLKYVNALKNFLTNVKRLSVNLFLN
jgi:hypothetical protein